MSSPATSSSLSSAITQNAAASLETNGSNATKGSYEWLVYQLGANTLTNGPPTQAELEDVIVTAVDTAVGVAATAYCGPLCGVVATYVADLVTNAIVGGANNGCSDGLNGSLIGKAPANCVRSTLLNGSLNPSCAAQFNAPGGVRNNAVAYLACRDIDNVWTSTAGAAEPASEPKNPGDAPGTGSTITNDQYKKFLLDAGYVAGGPTPEYAKWIALPANAAYAPYTGDNDAIAATNAWRQVIGAERFWAVYRVPLIIALIAATQVIATVTTLQATADLRTDQYLAAIGAPPTVALGNIITGTILENTYQTFINTTFDLPTAPWLTLNGEIQETYPNFPSNFDPNVNGPLGPITPTDVQNRVKLNAAKAQADQVEAGLAQAGQQSPAAPTAPSGAPAAATTHYLRDLTLVTVAAGAVWVAYRTFKGKPIVPASVTARLKKAKKALGA